MQFATEKWGARPHYSGAVTRLGEDEHGVWWWGPKGRPISRGDEVLFVSDSDVVFLTPASAWWSATWWLGHPETEVYVNIGTPAVIEADRVVSVDLDLDVVRGVDGACEVLDRDEFEAHRAQYGYPQDVVDAAEAACVEVLDLLRRCVPPFDVATPKRWVDLARRAS